MRFMPFINLKNKNSFILIALFFASIIVRYFLAKTNTFIYTYYDELIYLGISRSILDGQILVRNIPVDFRQFLYPLIISPASFINDPLLSYEAIKFINCIIMSSALFPAYLLAKKVTENKETAILIATLSILLPEMFLTTLVLSECLFYPLVLWLFYFIWEYMSCEKPKVLYFCVIIITVILLYFTKVLSLYFVPAIILMIFFEPVFKSKKRLGLIIVPFIIGIFYFFLTKYGLHYLNSISANDISFDKIKYMFYCVGIYCIYIVFAFFMFPLVAPIIEFKNLSLKLRQYIILNFITLLTACFVISTTVLLLEEYPNAIMRIHLRYLFPMLIPFLIVFLKISAMEIINLKAFIYTGIAFAVLSVIFIVIPPSGDSIIDSILTSLMTQSQADNILNLNFHNISLKVSNFDIFKNVMILFFIFGSLKIKKHYFSKLFLTVIVVLFIINNFIIYSVGAKRVLGQNSVKAQAIKLSTALNNQKSGILLVSKSVISDKIMETYLNKPYYLVLEQNFREDYNLENLPAVSLERGEIYEKTFYMEGINRIFANITYVILGKDTEILDLDNFKYRDITPEEVTEYRLLEVTK